MCLIIHRPAHAAPIPSGWIADFRTRNHDGFGAWWIENGAIQIIKTMIAAEIEPIIRKIEKKHVEAGFHWRMATHGAENVTNVHPFPVILNPKKPHDMVLAHNGVLSEWAPAKKDSGPNDTLNFIREMMVPFCQRLGVQHLFAPIPTFDRELLEFVIGSNRLLLTHTAHGFARIGDPWMQWRGLWLSNTYAWSSSQREREDGPIVAPAYAASYSSSYVSGWTYTNGRWEAPPAHAYPISRPQSAAHAQALSKREQKRLAKIAKRAAKSNPKLAATMERGPDGLYRFPGDPAPAAIAPPPAPEVPVISASVQAAPTPVHLDSLRDTADILAGMSEPEIKQWCESEPYEAARLIHELSARASWAKI